MNRTRTQPAIVFMLVATAVFAGPLARADVVTDWDATACEAVVQAKLNAPSANRVVAIVQTAVYEAANAVTRRYPASGLRLEAPPGASVEAAIAAASRATLGILVPSQRAMVDSAYDAALARIADGPAKSAGIAVGESAAAAVMAMRAEDDVTSAETYRPLTSPGVYVPTVIPVVPTWPLRKPWLMGSASRFRPGPPPALSSEVWARDYNEIKAVGGKNSTSRTAEQTEIARFWETTQPSIYHEVVSSVATAPGREITQNARLLAAACQAADDALIAIFDAKYSYNFWRPITAIRNGDIDGNAATERDPGWTPFIDTPMHPEYPCAHCIVAAAVGTVLEADMGSGSLPTLAASSPTANGAVRGWTTVEDFIQEVANARIYDGVHFRTSTEVGTDMGRQVGELAVARYLRPRE
jgi:hypothetical protein